MKTLIAIPCLNMVHTEFMASIMGLEKVGNTRTAITYSTLTYDARNNIANAAMEDNFDRILWLDSDMTFQPDLMRRLTEDMDRKNVDFVSALYFMRCRPTKPVIFSNLLYDHQPDQVRIKAENYLDYPKDSFFEIDGSGFGGVLMKVSMLRKVSENFGLPFAPMMGFGEDMSFCWRAKQLGLKMYCDSRIKMGHLSTLETTEKDWLAQIGADNA